MANLIQETNISVLAAVAATSIDTYRQVYEENRHRVYSLAFWMTDNELAAEEISDATFRRAFAHTEIPTEELIDRILLTEIRQLMPIGVLSLRSDIVTEIAAVRTNVKRIHLERAIVQLPATERLVFVMHDGEGYSHERIARTLGITEEESRFGLHQARIRIRELVADMQ